MQTKYVLGFMFSKDLKRVLLIEKQKPEWQKGKLNGVGGKIEKGETPKQAIFREFAEETGIYWPDFEEFGVLSGEDFEMNMFSAVGPIDDWKQTEAEQPVIVWVSALPSNVMPNLKWIVPLAIGPIDDLVCHKGHRGLTDDQRRKND